MLETSCLTNFRCTGFQFRGMGPIWLIRELPCKNLQCWGNSFKGYYYCLWSSTLLVSKMPKTRRKGEENRLFQKTRIQTILDKSPWDSTAIFILFLLFLVSFLKQCSIFEIFLQFSLPPPYTKLKLGKKFWIHASNMWFSVEEQCTCATGILLGCM